MEYVYAALLLHKLKQPVNEANVEKVISATGAKPDEIRVKALVSALGEVNIDEALKNAASRSRNGSSASRCSRSAQLQSRRKTKSKKRRKKSRL